MVDEVYLGGKLVHSVLHASHNEEREVQFITAYITHILNM